MEKEMTVVIEDNYKEMADEIDNGDELPAISSYVKVLVCICERNNIDLQVDIYGNSNNNTTITYDYCYTEEENAD